MFPRLFEIGPFSLPTYGVLVALGFLLGLHLAGRLARRVGMNPEQVTNLGVYIALSAIVGAKAFYILSEWDYYAADWSRLFSLSSLQAGGVFYGGLLAALAVTVLYVKRNRMDWLPTADVFAPSLAAGHAVGRLGCFAAGCCWGKPTDMPWAVIFTNQLAHEYVGVPLNIHLHPTQLYDAFGTGLIALFLFWRFFKPHAAGTIVGWYLILYSSFRFVVEFYRADQARPLLSDSISATQWVAVGLVILGTAILARNRNRHPVMPVEQAG